MNKQLAGQLAYLSGQSAETQVAASYQRQGYQLAETRWRGKAGEIDLIFKSPNTNDGDVVFVEVKKARRLEDAVHRISRAQQQRICLAAEEYIALLPKGALTPMRIDAAFVDGQGHIQICENAFPEF
jgi:putative endonuclease